VSYHEEDTRLHRITPALTDTGWKGPRITMEHPITAEQIVLQGDGHKQLKPKKVDSIALFGVAADRHSSSKELGLKSLDNLTTPVSPYEKQLWFDEIQSRVNAVRQLQAENAKVLEVVLPSVLDKALKGEL
jgi:hypothetical protein